VSTTWPPHVRGAVAGRARPDGHQGDGGRDRAPARQGGCCVRTLHGCELGLPSSRVFAEENPLHERAVENYCFVLCPLYGHNVRTADNQRRHRSERAALAESRRRFVAATEQRWSSRSVEISSRSAAALHRTATPAQQGPDYAHRMRVECSEIALDARNKAIAFTPRASGSDPRRCSSAPHHRRWRRTAGSSCRVPARTPRAACGRTTRACCRRRRAGARPSSPRARS
jgi:hypothetical protein